MSNLVTLNGQQYQEGDTPQDKEKEHVLRNAGIACGVSVITVAGLGTVGIPIVSIVGLGAIGLQLVGLFMVGYDHVDSSDRWEEMDKNTITLTDKTLGNLESLPMGTSEEYSTQIQAKISLPNNESNFINVEASTVIPEPLAPTVLEVPSTAAKPTGFGGNVKVPVKPSSTNIIESFVPVKKSLDVAQMLADDLYSYAVMSPSGGGKGMLVSNSLRLIKAMYPDIHIFLVDPKDDEKERGYWDGIVDTWCRCDFNSLRSQAKTDFIEGAIDKYHTIKGPKILVFDEATNIFGHLKNCSKDLFAELKSFLSGIASSGNSRKNYVWLIGHSGNLGDYGISGGEMSCFRKIYIAPMSNIEAIKQLGNTTFAGGKFGGDGVDYIKMVANQSKVSRAVYIGTIDSWEPMAVLENHSGYNRDLDTFAETIDVEVTSTKVTLPKSTNGSDLTLFQRAELIALSSTDVVLSCDIMDLKDTQHEPETIKKLEVICLSASLK